MKIICVEGYTHDYHHDPYYDDQPDVFEKITVCENVLDLLKIKEVRAAAIAAGWTPLEEIKEVHDKTVLEDKYYINYGYGGLQEVDITALKEDEIKQLSSTAQLVQKVDLKSVLSVEQYKIVAVAQKRRENLEKARAASQKERAEKSAQRKLDKAKRLLEEHEKKVAELQKKVK